MNKKIKITLGAVIVTIIVIVALLYFVVLAGEDESKFYGTWKVDIEGFDFGNATSQSYYTFNENGTFKITDIKTSFSDNVPVIRFDENDEEKTFTVKNLGPKSIEWGTFEIKSGKLHINAKSDIDFPVGFGFDYNFVNDNKFTLNAMMFQLEFNKVDESNIPDPTYNFDNIKWEDINVSVNLGFTAEETVHWDWIQLTRSSTPYSGEHAPLDWGYVTINDKIEIGNYQSEFITVKLMWVPNDEEIDMIFL